MSDIWHKADKTPEEDRVIVVKSKRTGEYLVGSEFEFILDNFTKWAYFDDLLALETELERTRETLDAAREAVVLFCKRTDIAMCALAEISKQHPNGCNKEWYVAVARNALEQITALEQKERE